MREIKFRAWRDHELVKPATLQYLIWQKYITISEQDIIDSYLFEQYIGLKDKNGVEIYEGDICKWLNIVFAVEWSQEDCAFILIGKKGGAMMNQDYLDNFEVVGNLHEDKDLMK